VGNLDFLDPVNLDPVIRNFTETLKQTTVPVPNFVRFPKNKRKEKDTGSIQSVGVKSCRSVSEILIKGII
jgi:hypothetical protein